MILFDENGLSVFDEILLARKVATVNVGGPLSPVFVVLAVFEVILVGGRGTIDEGVGLVVGLIGWREGRCLELAEEVRCRVNIELWLCRHPFADR